MNPEEATQMAGMLNWGVSHEPVQDIGIRVFKQYVDKEKKHRNVYEVTSREWNGKKWRVYQGKGSSPIEAMTKYAEDRANER